MKTKQTKNSSIKYINNSIVILKINLLRKIQLNKNYLVLIITKIILKMN